MRYGAFIFATDYAIRPDDLGRALEERGFESLWVPERTHIPASRRSAWPGGPNLPRDYWHTLDPFVALGAAAAVEARMDHPELHGIPTFVNSSAKRAPIASANSACPAAFQC